MQKLILSFLLFWSFSGYAQDDNSQRTETLVAMAKELYSEKKDIQGVNTIMKSAITMAPTNDMLYFEWAEMLGDYAARQHDLEMYKDCFNNYSKAVELNPRNNNAWLQWGIRLYFHGSLYGDDLKDQKEGIGKFEQLIAIDSTDYRPYYEIGVFTMLMNEKKTTVANCKTAINNYDKAIALNPQISKVWKNKGEVYLKMGQLEKNVLKYRPEIEQSCLKAELLGEQKAAFNLACLYAEINEKDLAFEWLEKAFVKNYNERMWFIFENNIEDNKSLNNIRRDARFKPLMKRLFDK